MTTGRRTGLAGAERRAPATTVVRAAVRPAMDNDPARTTGRAETRSVGDRRRMPVAVSAGEPTNGPTDRRATTTPVPISRTGAIEPPARTRVTAIDPRDRVDPRGRVVHPGPGVLLRATIAGRVIRAFRPALAVRGSTTVHQSVAAHLRRVRLDLDSSLPRPRSNPSPRTRSSSPGGAPSRRRSSRAAALTGCWSRRSAGMRSNRWCSMPPACGYRSSRSKAGR